MGSTGKLVVALFAAGICSSLVHAVFPFTGTPTLRVPPQFPIDQGDGLQAWIEDFNHPDNTRQWTDLAGNQSQAGWFNRHQDIDWQDDSGYMGIFNNKFFMTGLSEDMLGAPAAHVRASLLTDLGFGAGSGTRRCSVSFDVSFGDGDWFFLGDLGPGNPGEGEQVGFFDFAVETFNDPNDPNATGKPLNLRPRMICRPALQFELFGNNGSGKTIATITEIETTLRKTLNSAAPENSVRVMLTFDSTTGNLEGYIDCVRFLHSSVDDFGGLAGFLDMSRVEIQTGTFLEAGLPNDPFIGTFNYDNMVITNYVAEPGEIVQLIGAITRDIDGDGDFDADDGIAIMGCLTEPDNLIEPIGCVVDDFLASDHDCDGDADVRDYGRMQSLLR